MSMTGMNPDQIRRIGARLSAEATSLEQLQRAIDGSVGDAQRNWRGPDVERFSQEWRGKTRGDLTKVVAALRHLNSEALRNAAEQETASSGSSVNSSCWGQSGGSPETPGSSGWLGSLGSADWASLADWNAAFSAVDQGLYDWWISSSNGFVSAADHAQWLKPGTMLKGLGGGLGIFSLVKDGTGFIDAAQSGAFAEAAYSGVNTLADGLKMAPANPAYLTGVALSAWSWNVHEAVKLDWNWNSETNRLIRDPANFNSLVLGIDSPSKDPVAYTGQVGLALGKVAWAGAKRVLSFF